MKNILAGTLASGIALMGCTVMADPDFGSKDHKQYDIGGKIEKIINNQSKNLFGIKKPLANPATEADYVPRAQADADERVLLAKGLKATYITRKVGVSGDMMTLWPNEKNYTHLIVCIEQGRAADGLNAGLQSVDIKTGAIKNILYGMSRCDGIRTTAWGTVLATEETGDGRAYEIIKPLATEGHWVADRNTGDIRDGINSPIPSNNIVQRQALPTMAWEGLTVLASGVVIAGDELRPGSYTDINGSKDTDGGAIFKFVPDVPFNPALTSSINDLSDSPLASGDTYAMQVSCVNNKQQTGQGCEIGNAAWVGVDPLNARVEADLNDATGYYRPEDLHMDPTFDGEGVRFCWANTGNEGASNFGEVICGIDSDPMLADSDTRSVVVNRFFEGDPRFNSVDNLAFQPHTGNLYIIEDHKYGEVFACLPDGADRDIKTDGCIGVLSVVDPSAEPTGFMFDGSGKRAFLIIQHGEQDDSLLDFDSNPVDGRTDDLIMITGFKNRPQYYHH